MVRESPTRAELEELLAGEQLMQDIVFDASIAELLDEYMDDQRLKDALFGQGVIASWGGPKDKGTASIKLMHYQGDLEGQGPVWGYVKGGMGMISFAIADAAREYGAQLATGVPVAQILPGEGVVLEDGTTIRATTVISNADPKVTMRLLEGQDVPAAYRARIDAWKVRSPVVKFNAVLNALPDFTAAPGERYPAQATVDLTHGLEAAQDAADACARGEIAVGFGEVYVQTGYDPTPAPEGYHLLSVFGQYAPYDLAHGDWDSRRDEAAQQFISLIDTFAPGFRDILVHHEVLGPPHIEERVGLTGGNIFQGEVTPDQMWEHRLSARTPVAGLLPLRRRDASGGQRDRAERAQRGDGGAGGRGREPGPELRPAGARRRPSPCGRGRARSAGCPCRSRGCAGARTDRRRGARSPARRSWRS